MTIATVFRPLPKAGPIDAEMRAHIAELGKLWAKSPSRPRIDRAAVKHWDRLVAGWVESDLPLVVRKGGCVRGELIRHDSGRGLVVSDNSPAQWVFSRAFGGERPTLAGIQKLLDADEIPFAFATKTAEKSRIKYKRTLSPRDCVNKREWKLCHIEQVGLSTRDDLRCLPLPRLIGHMTRLLSPSNMFLVPKSLSGLGEVDDFITEVRVHDGGLPVTPTTAKKLAVR